MRFNSIKLFFIFVHNVFDTINSTFNGIFYIISKCIYLFCNIIFIFVNNILNTIYCSFNSILNTFCYFFCFCSYFLSSSFMFSFFSFTDILCPPSLTIQFENDFDTLIISYFRQTPKSMLSNKSC